MQRVILVTGFTSELGNAIAYLLVNSGFVTYVGARNIKRLDDPIKNVIPVELDVTSDASCEQAIDRIIRQAKRLDGIINVVGNTLTGKFSDQSSNDFMKLLDVNVIGAFRLMKVAVPAMSSQKGGHVINITSLNGFLSSPNFALYSASKHALQALDSAIAVELYQRNIHVVSVAPGALLGPQTSTVMTHLPARQAIPILNWLLPLTPISVVADEIIKILNNQSPSPLVLVGRDAHMIYLLQRFLPNSVWFWIQNRLWKKQS